MEELEHFAAITAHDLKAPLQSIKGFAELSLSRAAGDDRLAGYLDSILGGCATMESLIEALLSYARSGSATPADWPVDTAEAVARVQSLLAGKIAERGAVVEVGALPHVNGDPIAIIQLFQNLIDNGLSHGRQGRPRVTVSGSVADGWAEFSVADDGLGIPAADRGLVFLPLVRLAGGDGHGLGLAICQRIVERMGGRIWVQEGAAGGADFRFRLPLWRDGGGLPMC